MVAQCAADGGLAEAFVRTALELAPHHAAAAATLAQLLAEHARLGVLPDDQASPPPLPPVLNGHVSSILPY
jgi:hypothetical protein